MDAAKRYQRDLDIILQELQAKAEMLAQARQKNREVAWGILEKSFSRLADIKGLTQEQRDTEKERWLRVALGEDDNSN